MLKLKKYQKNSGISIIRKNVSSVNIEAAFSLTSVTSDGILKEIKRPDTNKAFQGSDTKLIKQFPSLIVDFLIKNINCCLAEGTFANDF